MKQYFSFSNTAARSEYWGVQILSWFPLVIVLMILGRMITAGVPDFLTAPLILMSVVAYVWILLATAVRRCRDAGISPWWVAAFVIPFVNFVLWIALGVIKTDPQNVQDPQPKS